MLGRYSTEFSFPNGSRFAGDMPHSQLHALVDMLSQRLVSSDAETCMNRIEVESARFVCSMYNGNMRPHLPLNVTEHLSRSRHTIRACMH